MPLPPRSNWYPPSGTFPHGTMDYAGSNLENNGIVIYSNGTQYITVAAVTDGLSNTLMVGEKRLDACHLGQYMSDDNEGYTAGWDHDSIRSTTRLPLPDNCGLGWGELRFGGPHPGIFIAVFGDGSVRGISYAVDLTNFSRMGQRNDGQPINFQDW
jgi:hypothetical protein